MRTTRIGWGAALTAALLGCSGGKAPPPVASNASTATAASTTAAASAPTSAAPSGAKAASQAAPTTVAANAPAGETKPAAAEPAAGTPFLAKEYFAAVHLRPAKILSAPLVTKVMGLLLPPPAGEGTLGAMIAPREQQRIVEFAEKLERWKGIEEAWLLVFENTSGVGPKLGFSLVVKSKAPLSAEAFVTKLLESPAPEPIEADGKKLLVMPNSERGEDNPFVFHQQDPKTVLGGSKKLILRALSGEPEKSPITALAASQKFDGPFTLIAVPGPFKKELDQAKAALDGMTLVAPFDKLPEQIPHLESAVLKLSLEGPHLIVLDVALDDEAAGAKLKETLDEVWTEGKMLVGMGAQQAKALLGDKAETVVKELRDKVAVAAAPRGASLSVGLPGSLDGAIDEAVKVAIPKLRAQAERVRRMNNLRQVALAFHNYESAHRKLPADVVKEGKPLLSWRVAVLPYIDETTLSEEFKRDEAWDSAANKPFLEKMPAVYETPGAKPGHTSIFVFKGKHTAFTEPGVGGAFSRITDGTSNTIMLIAAKPDKAVPWTEPSDIDFNPEKMAEILEALPENDVLVARYDGSVYVWKSRPKAEVLQALITADGGEVAPMVD